MAKRLEFLSFWAINDALDIDRLKAQMDELRDSGLDGVVFHPRFYPNQPAYMSQPYLDIVSEIILYAKSIGMKFWIYDENGWPSGTAGGEVLARLPESQCRWVEYKEGQISFGAKQAVSSFDPKASEVFLEFTHEGYRKGLVPEAFDYVTGFFADEVAFLDGHGLTVKTGAVPWDDRLPQIYEEKYGESLIPLLPLLFVEGEDYERVRIRYWEMLTDVLLDGFYRPVAAWCEKHGKRFTAHVKAEENPFFQLSYSGSCFQVLKSVETPAIDALERYPGNNFYPRIAHSIAMQKGRDSCLVEAMGGGGWGVSPESFTNYVMWLASHGIEQFVLHLNQLKLTTQAIQDWPPSMPCHMTWKDAFPLLLASLQRQAAELPDLKKRPDVLIVTPTRGIMASFNPADAMQINEHDGSNVPDSKSGRLSKNLLKLVEALYAAGIHYELSEERTIEEDGVIERSSLRIGKREYKCLLIAEGCLWSEDGREEKLRLAGVIVFGVEDWEDALQVAEVNVDKPAVTSVTPMQPPWQVRPPAVNQVLVEFEKQEDGTLTAEFSLREPETIGELSLFLHDPVSEVSMSKDSSGKRLHISVTPLNGGEACPIAYLRGRFAAISQSPIVEKDARQWITEGPFVLVPLPESLDGKDLIASGLPFAGLPVQATKNLWLDSSIGTTLQLTQVQGDVAHIWLGAQDLGWCWGPDWKVELPAGLIEGEYECRVELYPSTFNVYGPHHHIDGDRYLTSPAQYLGSKNFADRLDAPEDTSSKFTQTIKWGISGEIKLIKLNPTCSR